MGQAKNRELDREFVRDLMGLSDSVCKDHSDALKDLRSAVIRLEESNEAMMAVVKRLPRLPDRICHRCSYPLYFRAIDIDGDSAEVEEGHHQFCSLAEDAAH